MQDRVKETSYFKGKEDKLYNDYYDDRIITCEECNNGLDALYKGQMLPTKMTSLLKKSSRTRPELTKALGVPSQLKN